MAQKIDALSVAGLMCGESVLRWKLPSAATVVDEIEQVLSDHGFKANKSDVCFYSLSLAGRVIVLLLLYVDDILIAATTAWLATQYPREVSARSIVDFEIFSNIKRRATNGLSVF